MRARGRADGGPLQQLNGDKSGIQSGGLTQRFQLRYGIGLHQHLGIPVDRDTGVYATALPGPASLKGATGYPPGDVDHLAAAAYLREEIGRANFPPAAVKPARKRFSTAHRAV